jgi:ADP-heptose:LPS heptosyltransferase
VHDLLIFDAPWVHKPPPPLRISDLVRTIWRIRHGRYHDSLILTSAFQSAIPTALVLRIAGVKRICAVSHDYPGSLLDLRIDIDDHLHEAQRSARIAQAAGYPDVGDDLRVRDDVTAYAWPARPYVVVHPGADVPARQWDKDRAREAVAALSRTGYEVLVTGGPEESDLTRYVAADHGTDLGGRTSLRQLAGILRNAQAIVVGNTGPAHLAAAVGTPVVSLFAPVVPAHKWGPYGVAHVMLGDQNAPCADTRAARCPIPGHPCITSVTADEVVAAVQSLTVVAA